jgi:hypothetical protein
MSKGDDTRKIAWWPGGNISGRYGKMNGKTGR